VVGAESALAHNLCVHKLITARTFRREVRTLRYRGRRGRRRSARGLPALTAAFELLGKRWTALVLDVLAVRPARFCEIHRAIPGLSDRLLAERLRELQAAGLVRRSDGAHTSPYELTDRGARLLPGLDEIRGWARARPAAPA
jgi:DNA-binding HxlR family transcriptional regulator